MEIIIKRKSVEVNLILDILIGYQNKERLGLEFEKLGMTIPKECLVVYKDIDNSNSKFKELVKYYFCVETDELDKLHYLVAFLNLNFSFYDLAFEEYLHKLKVLTKEQVLRNILASIAIFDDETMDYKDVIKLLEGNCDINEEAVLKRLDKSRLSNSFKWKVYKLIKDYEQSVNDIVYILEEFKRIKSKNYEILLDITYKWADEVKDIPNERYIEYFNGIDKNLDLSNIKKVYVKPVSSWKCYNFEWRIISDEVGEVIIGYNIEKTLDRFRRGKSEEWFKDVLKLLADPTRYKILKLLSKKQMYSGELATETGMSQGTISHHMRSLVLYDIVESFRVDGRMYYKLNREKFKSWVEVLRKKL